MATKKQIDANRLNSRKSTGPRTPHGKAHSSMNALRTGIDAETHLIPGELPAQLNTLREEYFDRYHPVTPAQRMYVDTLIDCEWLLRRLRKVEASIWKEGANDGAPMTAEEMSRCFRHTGEHFARLQRRIDSTQRNYRRALDQLERLQAAEAPELERDPVPATAQRQTANPENGFVPPTLMRSRNPAATLPSPGAPAPL
jgi:hypothetical protein